MLREQYDSLTGDREGFLYQARKQSEITIPSLIPPDGTGSNYSDLYKPYQSIGAYGVNALANKLVTALYPPTQAFFKFDANTSMEEIEELDQAQLEAIDTELAAMENKIQEAITKRGDRGAIAEVLKHLIVAGNVVLYVGDESSRYYTLDEYVAMRDGEGNLLKLITKDTLSYETFKEAHPSRHDIHQAHRGNRSFDPKSIDVYTCMSREDGYWYIKEEAAGVVVSDTQQKHPINQPPYLVLRFNRVDGQSYGRAYVENLFGDLRSLENLSRAMVEAAAINARTVFLVNPSGVTSARRFEEAANGDVIPGMVSDITTARVDKGADLAVTASEIDRLERRLSQAFMLASSAQRDAERVTATEVRAVTAEVESTLGGSYSVLSEEFQRPYITRLINVLQKSGSIPQWPEELLDVSIVTGTAGIGRGIDRQRMTEFIQALSQTLGQDVLKQYLNVDTGIARLAASFGIELNGLIKSKEEIAAETEASQQAMMAEKLGPNAVTAAGQVATEQIKQGVDPNNASQEVPEA